VWLCGTLVLALGGCGVFLPDKTPERVKSGVNELDLTVTGRPSPGTLSITERMLARLKARDAHGLAELAEEGATTDDAKRWVSRWGDAAQRPATADFGEGEKDASVDIRFTGEPSALAVLLVPEDEKNPYDDRYVVVLRESASAG
jgi:hypothetical protein